MPVIQELLRDSSRMPRTSRGWPSGDALHFTSLRVLSYHVDLFKLQKQEEITSQILSKNI